MEQKSLEVFESMPVPKAVFRNALPAMAAMLMVLVYNLADTFFIGQTHDALQVAAVSLATPVFLMFMAVGTVFGMGGTSVISRALGEGRKDYAKKACSFCMWGCVIVGVVMAALFLIFMEQILSLIGASSDTWDLAKTYLMIVVCSGPFVLISNCYSNVIRTEGESGRACMGQLLGNLLNVVLDPIMILGFGWNIAGAAIATVIGNVFGAGYYLPGKGLQQRACHWSTRRIRLYADERFTNHYQQPNGRIRRYGDCRNGRCDESCNDNRYGMYWAGAGRTASAGILCRREAMETVQGRV